MGRSARAKEMRREAEAETRRRLTVERPEGDLQSQLHEQVGFLVRSCQAFDEGAIEEAARIAATLRILVHNTSKSASLLTQLTLDQWMVVSSQCSEFKVTGSQGQPSYNMAMSEMAVFVNGPEGTWWSPQASQSDVKVVRQTELSTWWLERSARTPRNNSLNRSEVALTVANKDGGAHVDARLPIDYFDLTRTNLSGVTVVTSDGDEVPMPNPVRSWLRQMAQDMLITLDNYGRVLDLEPIALPTPAPDHVPPDRTPPGRFRFDLPFGTVAGRPAPWLPFKQH